MASVNALEVQKEGPAMSNTTTTIHVNVGLDLGDTYSAYCLMATDGEVLQEGKVRTTSAALSSLFAGIPQTAVVLEAGTQSPWISRLLASLGHDPLVLNPYRVRLIAESAGKSDRADAQTLAFLAQFPRSALRPVHHRSQQMQADLAVLRARHAAVSSRTALINAVRSQVKVLGGRIPACDARLFHRHAPDAVPQALRPALLPLLSIIANLTQTIAAYDRQLITLIADRYPEAKAVQQVHGIGPLISLAFILTLADPHRFRHSRQVGPYLGLTPRLRQSGARSPQLGISKAGDTYLRQLLIQGAHYILGWRGEDSDLRRWGLARLEQGGKNAKKRTIVAVARKLAVLLHHLWVSGEVYEPLHNAQPAIAA